MKCVTLVSGGLDSTVLAYYLAYLKVEQILLGFNYGQKHIKELLLARRTAEQLGAEFLRVNMKPLSELFTASCLTNRNIPVPTGGYTKENMSSTVVPNRNAIMLSLAFAIAANKGYDFVAIATHAGDHFIYPDCRPKFMAAFDVMESYSLGDDYNIKLLAPFIESTKTHIVALGSHIGVPFKKTWSCYVGGDKHCGKCGTCVERKKAFEEAGVEDPTEYENDYTK